MHHATKDGYSIEKTYSRRNELKYFLSEWLELGSLNGGNMKRGYFNVQT